MLTAPARKKNGTQVAVVVLDPASLALLRNGKPIEVDLNRLLPGLESKAELILSYTNDIVGFAKNLVANYGTKAEDIETKRGTDMNIPNPQSDEEIMASFKEAREHPALFLLRQQAKLSLLSRRWCDLARFDGEAETFYRMVETHLDMAQTAMRLLRKEICKGAHNAQTVEANQAMAPSAEETVDSSSAPRDGSQAEGLGPDEKTRD